MKRKVLFPSIVFLGVMIVLGCWPDPDSSRSDRDSTVGDKDILFGTYQTNGEIHRMTADGEGLETVITNGIYPRVSPDETKIVYESFDDGDAEIWIADIDGANARQLTYNTAEDKRPFFSPDGTQITYTLTDGSISRIYVADSDGSNATSILPSGFYWSWGSHWSPTGTSLVFTAWLGNGADPYNNLYTVDPDGGNLSPLYTSANGQEPYFSPDGSQIVFVGYENGNKQIFMINRDGTGAQQILSTSYDCFQPFWIW
ncbi:MAG: TolB family protein [Alkalispirochaeta sp.]